MDQDLAACQTHLQTVVLHHLLLVISEVSLLQADLAHQGHPSPLVLDPMVPVVLMVLLIVVHQVHMVLTISSWDLDHLDLTTLVLMVLVLGLVQVLRMDQVQWVLMVLCMVHHLTSWKGLCLKHFHHHRNSKILFPDDQCPCYNLITKYLR